MSEPSATFVTVLRFFRFLGVDLVVSFFVGVAVVYANETAGGIAAIGAGLLVCYPAGWLIVRLGRLPS